MRLATISALAACGLFVARQAEAASYSIVSGTLHAQATATSPTSGVVNDNPADTILGPGTPSGNVAALAQSHPGFSDAGLGSFTSTGGVGSQSISLQLQGRSQGNAGQPGSFGSGSGSGSIDLMFVLDTPSQVQWIGSGSSPSNAYFTGNATLLNNSAQTVASFNLVSGGTISFLNLDAGQYDLKVTGDVHVAAGTGNSGSASYNLNIVPEPLTTSMLVASGGIALLHRRRRYAVSCR